MIRLLYRYKIVRSYNYDTNILLYHYCMRLYRYLIVQQFHYTVTLFYTCTIVDYTVTPLHRSTISAIFLYFCIIHRSLVCDFVST